MSNSGIFASALFLIIFASFGAQADGTKSEKDRRNIATPKGYHSVANKWNLVSWTIDAQQKFDENQVAFSKIFDLEAIQNGCIQSYEWDFGSDNLFDINRKEASCVTSAEKNFDAFYSVTDAGQLRVQYMDSSLPYEVYQITSVTNQIMELERTITEKGKEPVVIHYIFKRAS